MPDIVIFNPFKRFYGIHIPAPIASFKGLSPGAKLVYGRLQRYAGKKGVAFPNIPEVANEVGLCERQTKKYICELVDQKFILRQRVFAQGNVYSFILHPCLNGDLVEPGRGNQTAFKSTEPIGRDAEPIGRDAARQADAEPIGRDAAPAIGRDAARQEAAVSLLLLRESLEENQIISVGSSENSLDPELLYRNLLRGFKGLKNHLRKSQYANDLKNTLQVQIDKLDPRAREDDIITTFHAFAKEDFWHGRFPGATVNAFFKYLENRLGTPGKIHTTPGKLPVGEPTSQPPTADTPKSPDGLPGEVLTWNRIVGNGVAVTRWKKTGKHASHLEACQKDTDWTPANLEVICQKIVAIRATGDTPWMSFWWLIDNDNWLDVLNGRNDWYLQKNKPAGPKNYQEPEWVTKRRQALVLKGVN